MTQAHTDEEGQREQEKQCEHCAFTYANTRSGRARHMQHVKTQHHDQTVSGRQRKEQEEKLADLSPMALRLHEVAGRVVSKPTTVETMVNVFNRYSETLGGDRHRFRSWVQKYGLTPDQVNQIEDEMFGLDDVPALGGTAAGPGGHTVGYLQSPGGGYQPIIILSPPAAARETGSREPFIIQSPLNPPRDPETREEIREMGRRIDAVLEQVRKLTPAEARPEAAQPMRRIPMLDDEGAMMRDVKGQLVFQEVPYDPTMGVIEMMKALAEITKAQAPQFPPAKEIDEEVLVLKIRDKLRDDLPKERDDRVSADLQRILDEHKASLQQVSAKLSQLERDSEIKVAVKEAVEPLFHQLEEARGRAGMSDNQFTLSHREKMAGIWQSFLGSLVGGVREDIRPMIIQNAVAAMKQLGIPDEIVQAAVSSFSTPSRVSGPLHTKAEEARQKWLR